MATVLFAVFVVALAIGFPIAIVMGGAGLVALLWEGKLSLLSVPQRLFDGINSFPLMAVPFFILAADLMTAGGITTALLRFSNSLVGHIRGGMGHVNVLTSVFFAGISGSALADAAGPGAIEMRMMEKSGYDKYYAAALSAATATIGPIIPPSIIMVIYALTDSRVTVAGLFLAGVVPGLLLGAALMAANHAISIRRGYGAAHAREPWRTRLQALWRATPVLLMPAIIIGGILSGCSRPPRRPRLPSSMRCSWLVRHAHAERPRDRARAPAKRARVLGRPAHRVDGVAVRLAADPGAGSQDIARAIGSLTSDPLAVLLIVALFVLVCGLFIDTLPAVIILVPVLAPLSEQFGIHPLHFAMAVVLNLTIGMITPPVGRCCS